MRWMNRTRAALAVAALCTACHGQTGAPIEIPYVLSSGPQINDSDSPQIVWTGFVDVPFAGTLQLVFQSVTLGGLRDSVVVESVLDGEIQELDAPALQLWRHQTAWFNGTRVAVSLRLAPGSYGAVEIALVRAGPPSAAGPESLCGADDRVASTDARVCRLYGSGGVCTGWLVNELSQILTAGHCVNCPGSCPYCTANVSSPGALVVAQFHVPQSTSAGAIVAPAIQHQYPVLSIDANSPAAGNCPVAGNDWAIATLAPNVLLVSAAANQGAWFTLANYAPPVGASVRVTGFGTDSTPATANFTLQTSTGPVTNASTLFYYAVDTEGGNSGGPVMVEGGEADDQAVAIHTSAGCSSTPGSANAGTGLQGAGVRTALVAENIVDDLALADGVTRSIATASTWFYLAFGAGKWNAVTVVPDGNWDLSIGQSGSDGPSTSVEALVSNGHLGTPWTAGTAYRKAVTAGARLQHAVGVTFAVGTAASGSLSGTRLARLLEFQVPAAGAYNVAVTGSTGLRWRLLGPGTGADWVNLQAPSAIGGGNIGGPSQNDVSLAAGWHAVLVYRASSATLNTTESFSVNVCASGSPSLALSEGVPATITNACQAFSTSPASGRWNVVGLASPSIWDTYIGATVSQAGAAGNLVLADGRAGIVPTGQGVFVRRAGTDSAVAESRRATASAANSGQPFSLPAGAVFRAFEFDVTAAGTHSVNVTGDAGLAWRLFEPQASGSWIDIDDDRISGTSAGTPATVSLQSGWHCLVVFRAGGVSAAAASGTVSVCSGIVIGLGSGGNGVTVTSACQMVSLAATTGVWDAVALNSDAATNWNLHLGTADATAPAGTCDLAVSDGRAGTIAPTRASLNRVSGTAAGFVQQAGRSTLTPGTPLPLTLNASTIAHLVEVPIAAADDYDLSVTGTAGLRFDVFAPRADANWAIRAGALFASLAVGAPGVQNVVLQPGVHAIVVYRPTGTGATTCTVSVQPSPHPVPVLTSMSPASTAAAVPVPVLTLNGSAFEQAAQVRWNGAAIPTSWVNANQLTAAPPPSLFTTGVAAAITVFNPAPGGGTSNPLTFTVFNPAPALSVVAPSTATAGGAGFTMSVIGTGFTTGTVIRWNGTPLATVLAFPPNLVDVSVPASLIANGGLASITAFSPSPGGGTSAPLSFQVNNPAPALTLVGPNSATAGGPGFTMTVIGTGFTPSTVIRWNGTPLASVFAALPNLIDVSVPASLIANGGTASITAFSPAPGGGTTAPLTFTVNNPAPALTLVGPSTATAGGPGFTMTVIGTGFTPSTVIRWNGTPLTPVFSALPNLIDVAVPASLIANAGSAAVTAFSPTPGGGTSAPVTFTINNPVPSIASISPAGVSAGGPAFTLTVTGANFNTQSVVRLGTASLATTLAGPTQLQAAVPASAIAAGGPQAVSVLNPAPGGGATGSLTLSVTYPVPVLTGLSVTGLSAGSPAMNLVATGSGFTGASQVSILGTPRPTMLNSATTLEALLTAADLALPGAIPVLVLNPAPGGGSSTTLTITARAPVLATLAPALILVQTPASPPVTLTVTGTDFLPGSIVHANGVPLATVASGATLTASLPASIPQALEPGGIAINVANGPLAVSNTRALVVGGGSNAGTIRRHPLDPAPGQAFAAVLEGGTPNAVFSLYADLGTQPPVTAFPDPAADLVLAVTPFAGSPGPLVPLVEGLGIFGPATLAMLLPDGSFTLPGFVVPATPFGIDVTIQAVYLDPSATYGFRLTWARRPDQF